MPERRSTFPSSVTDKKPLPMQERTIQRCLLRGGLLLVLIVPVLLGSGSQAMAQACTSELPNANDAYTFGRFDEAIQLLNECLKKQGVLSIEQQQSHRLLALSYIGKDEPSQARASVRKLVSQAPDYQPDPEQDPPSFAQMVQEVQRELEQAAALASKTKPQTPAPVEQSEKEVEQDTKEDLAAQAEAFSQAGNDREALPLFREAAEQGHPGAQYRLGLMYRQGDVIEHDDEKAMTWFRKAAEQGHAEAQFYVGWLHWKGEGAEQKDEEAIKWFRKAAEQGHERALRVLHRMTGKS